MTTATQSSELPAPDTRTVRRRRRIRNIVLGVLGAIFAVWLVLFVTKGRFLKHPFERIASSASGRTVAVGGDFQLYFAPFEIKFLAERLRVSNPAWASRPDLFAAARIDTRIAPLSLLFGRRRVRWIELVDGAVDLEWDRAHRANTWTFADSGGDPFEMPLIGRATVAGTTLRYRDPAMALVTDIRFETVRATGEAIGQAVRFAGTGTARETPFRLAGALLSPDATVGGGENRLRLHVDAAHNAIDIAGTLPGATEIEGVPLRTRARGRNMAELLAIIGVALPATRDYTLTAQLVKRGDEYRFTHMRGRFGDSDVAGRLTVTNGERLRLASTLATRRLDIVDAAPFIGYNPDIVAEQGAVAAAAATGAAPQRLMPDAAFPVEMMRRFDASLKWSIAAIRSRNLPISDVDLTLSLDDGRLALSPLTFAMARGTVSSDLVFDTRPRPSAVSYDVRLSPTPMARLLAGYGVAEAGTFGTSKGRIELAGRGGTIHQSLASANGRIAFVMPAGTLWTRNVQLAELDLGTFVQKMFEDRLKEPVRVNCGLLGFTVRSGVAAADPILIDTTKNVILGRGGFSFRTEAVDLAFRADGKKFSLFSAQSPVGIGGRFAEPKLDVVSDELLGRAGVGLGLALVASPLAGVLAFVDVGDAKSTACGPVLAGATAAAQRTTKGKPRDDVGRGTTAKDEDGTRSKGERREQRKKFLGIF